MLCFGMWIAVCGGMLAWTYVGGKVIGCVAIFVGIFIAGWQEAKIKKRIKDLEGRHGCEL